ncbi:uncharacterized protein [Nicotiana tomentosiformis]|uniref:uncharacterized protein n=1 Tax=Nicotiana tomentosiformis TaxID=4098 RepID=UPI00388CE7D3
MVRRNGGIPKRGSYSKPKNYDLYHKCGKPGYFIKECHLLKQDQYKNNFDKVNKRNPILDKRFKRKNTADHVIKRVLAAWGDSSSESEEENDHGDSSMMASDDDEDYDDDEVNFLDVRRNLKFYSPKKLMSLENVLIDAYHSLINDNYALTVELEESEQTRDELVIVVVDLKETIENLKKEKDALDEKIANIEHERDDLMVAVVDLKETLDLKETIGEPKIESRPENSQKGKEVASEAHIKLEKFGRVKSDLEKSLKWTWPSDAITAMYTNNGGNRQRIGFQREKIPYNLHSKYVTVPDNWICTHCGNTGHFKENYKTRFQSQQKNIVFAEKGTVKESSTQWYMDCGFSKHITGSITDFLSFKALQRGSVSFGNGKKGYILGLRRIGKSLSHSIENVFPRSVTRETRWNLCHKRLGHASFTLLNKLVRKDLVRGLPKSSFKNHKVCDASVKGKQVRSSFKPKREVSTSKSLNLLHMDLCGLMRVASRGGKKYIFVIVDDYSRFTWTLFLRTKDETFEVFVAFVKRIQVKMGNNVACIGSDNGIEFDNAKFDEFCTENGITNNFLPLRTPQQNGIVERKNRTLEDMARTMLIDSGITKNFWEETVNTACYLMNRCMIRSLLNKNPYELLNGRKPKLTHLRTFGCKYFFLNNGKEALGIFEIKSCIWVRSTLREISLRSKGKVAMTNNDKIELVTNDPQGVGLRAASALGSLKGNCHRTPGYSTTTLCSERSYLTPRVSTPYNQTPQYESPEETEKAAKTSKPDEMARKVKSLEQNIKNIQGLGGHKSVSFSDLCMFPPIHFPPGFKTPNIEKYNGHGQLRGAGGKEELLMAYFDESLMGVAYEWFIDQDISHWHVWDDMAQLKHMGMIGPIAPHHIHPDTHGFQSNARCEYHSGAPGHNTDDYWTLNKAIERLIAEKLIVVTNDENPPNVTNNPLPAHNDVHFEGIIGRDHEYKQVGRA